MPLTANAAFTERHKLITTGIVSPAAGLSLFHSLPAGQVWQIVAVTFGLTTSAVVADRRAYVAVRNGGNINQCSTSSYVQPASQAYNYYFSCGIAPLDATADVDRIYAPLACGMQLYDQDQFVIIIDHIDPADAIRDILIRYYGWKED